MTDYWLFGYGSLIFKPPPHVVEAVPGYAVGSVRRFWQSSNDHRGTPESPGRVVTLITKEYWLELGDPHKYGSDDKVNGIAYRIDPDHAEEVREYMDYREKNGYRPVELDFHPSDTSRESWKCTTYVGTPGNEAFVGPEEPEVLAKRIATSVGKSGRNIDYLKSLHHALIDMVGYEDKHIADLVSRASKYE